LSYLSDKQLLLLLDNFEHLLDGVGLLDEIIQHAPQVKILITSREYLHHDAEWILDVGGLAVPPIDKTVDKTEDIHGYSAVQLFIQSAHRSQATFTLSAADAPYVAQICRTLAGMPLGIKLAAAWVRSLSCATICAEITRNLDFAALMPHGLPDRHQSLRAVIDSSWQRLALEEQEVLAKLALFRRAFGLEAAQQVAGATTKTLARLADKSLLHIDHADNLNRYFLHELLCQFGLEQLQARGELEATRASYTRYYTTWLAQQAAALTGPKPQPTLRLLDIELDNIRAAWQWAIQTYDATAIVMATPVLSLYHDYRTLLQEALQLFGDAAERLKHAPTSVENEIARCKVLGYYGLYLFRFAEPLQAEKVLQESLALATQHHAMAEKSYALYVLGYNAIGAGQAQQGEEYLLSGLALAESGNDPILVVKILYALGWYYGFQGREQEGLVALERGLVLARTLGDLRSEAHVLYYLGQVRAEIGEYAQAKQCYEESLHLFEELDVHWGIAQAEHGLIKIAYALQDYAETKRLCELAIPLYEKIKAHSNTLEYLRYIYARVSATD
jgi:predicted ATPase